MSKLSIGKAGTEAKATLPSKSLSLPPNQATPRRDIGAIVFLIAHGLGDFEVMSLDRKVRASGSSLDQAWWRYYRKSYREMKRNGKLEAAHLDGPMFHEEDDSPDGEDDPVVNLEESSDNNS